MKTARLHKRLSLTGAATTLFPFLLDPPPEAVKYLEILELDHISSSSPEEYHRFWSLLKLFLATLKDKKANLHTLILTDSTDSFLFRESSVTFEMLVPTLKSITIGCQVDSEFSMPDQFIHQLIKSCPHLESFSDQQFHGLSIKSIRALALGLSKLTSLTLETSNLPTMHFLRILPLFSSLQHLQVSNFSNGPLQDNLDELRLALLKLASLKSLAIDLTTTPHKDGLKARDWNMLLQGMGSKIHDIRYIVDLQSFYGDEASPSKTASYVWQNQISNIPLASLHTHEEKRYISTLESVAHLFKDELKIKRWTFVISF